MPLSLKVAIGLMMTVAIAGYIDVVFSMFYNWHTPLYNLITAVCSFGVWLLATELIDAYKRL